jgi:hypothetical protein
VNHAIRHRGPAAQAVEVFHIAPKNLSTDRDKRVRAGLRPGKAQYLMARADQFLRDGGPNKSRGSCNEYAHVWFLSLNTLLGGASTVFESSYAQIWAATRALVKRAIKTGDIRKDLDPLDLLRALIGVSHVASSPNWQQSARRLVDILITGSRPVK